MVEGKGSEILAKDLAQSMIGVDSANPERHPLPHVHFRLHLCLLSPCPPKQDEKAGRGWTGFPVTGISQFVTTISALSPLQPAMLSLTSSISVSMCFLK